MTTEVKKLLFLVTEFPKCGFSATVDERREDRSQNELCPGGQDALNTSLLKCFTKTT